MINFAYSELNRMILHRVHSKKKDGTHSLVEFDEELIDFSDEVKGIIKNRVNEACGKQSKSFKLQVEKFDSDSFFSFAKEMNNLSDENFIAHSKSIGSLLSISQKKSNIPGGYILVIEGISDDEKPFTLIIKAELHEAFTTSIDENTNKKKIEILKNIFLSPAEKFFKIGILKRAFNLDETYPNDEYSCLIYDDQFTSGGKPAEFFYKDFLGFSIDKNEKFLTRGFFDETTNVVIKNSKNYEEKKGILTALKTLVKQDKTQIIDPTDFGNRYLEGKMLEDFNSNILSQPKYTRPFTKDTSLMGQKLDKRKIEFSDDVFVQGPEELFDENVRIVSNIEEANMALNNPNETLLRIKGKPE